MITSLPAHNSRDITRQWEVIPVENIPSSINFIQDVYPYIWKNIHLIDFNNLNNNRIIDFGCGTGKTCFQLYEKGISSIPGQKLSTFYSSITGVDINLHAIKYAIENKNKYFKNAEIEFKVSDLEDLKLEKESFDFGIIQAVLTTVYQPKKQLLILEQLHKVLSNKGYLYIADFAQNFDSVFYHKRYDDGIKQIEIHKGLYGTFPVINEVTGEIYYYAHHYTKEEMESLLKKANFQILFSEYNAPFKSRSGKDVKGIVIIAQKI